jgi:ABC-type branched-subunit amino acid transport system ATPase component
MTQASDRPALPERQTLLSVRGVSVRFGGIVALDNVSFDVARGEICGLIGPNGAGKTTLFNCMSRLYPYQSGDIVFEGRSLTHVPVHRIAGLGLGRTFQNLAMFRTMSVTDNVMVGAHARSRRRRRRASGPARCGSRPSARRKGACASARAASWTSWV